jgi:hypothetical protein
MAKADDWRTFRNAKIEIQVTAAMVTALATLTTAEWIADRGHDPGDPRRHRWRAADPRRVDVARVRWRRVPR